MVAEDDVFAPGGIMSVPTGALLMRVALTFGSTDVQRVCGALGAIMLLGLLVGAVWHLLFASIVQSFISNSSGGEEPPVKAAL